MTAVDDHAALATRAETALQPSTEAPDRTYLPDGTSGWDGENTGTAGRRARKRWRAATTEDTGHPAPDTAPADGSAPQHPGPDGARQSARLLSLDAFRGLTIFLMLLVNNVALDSETPAQLQHAPWDGGVHLADMVYPWFLFCVGVAIPFAAASFRRSRLSSWRYDLKVVGRASVLLLLGCLVDSSLAKRPVFSLGVLQTIGLAYLVGAMLYDLPWPRRLGLALSLLAAYGWAIRSLPIPGAGAGIFQEDENFIRHLNRTYFASYNLWGLPSVVPTSALVLIGTVLGDLLRRELHSAWKLLGMVIAGLVFTEGALLWSRSLAFNKATWTPSYILLAAGTGALALGFFYLTMDVGPRSGKRPWRWWAYPLLVFGSNAILAYVAPILVKVLILKEWQVSAGTGETVSVLQWLLDTCIAHAGRVTGGEIYTLGYIALWWLILWQLYRKRIFLRV